MSKYEEALKYMEALCYTDKLEYTIEVLRGVLKEANKEMQFINCGYNCITPNEKCPVYKIGKCDGEKGNWIPYFTQKYINSKREKKRSIRMNRPKLTEDKDMLEHIYELEAYCDELEQENFELSLETEEIVSLKFTIEALEQHVRALEKALDKACEKLTTDTDDWCNYDVCPFVFEDFGYYKCGHLCKEKDAWKKHFLKEVQDEF